MNENAIEMVRKGLNRNSLNGLGCFFEGNAGEQDLALRQYHTAPALMERLTRLHQKINAS